MRMVSSEPAAAGRRVHISCFCSRLSKLCTESGFGKSECRAQSCCRWTAGKTCVWIDYEWSECRTGTRLDVTAADARGAGAFSTLLLVGALLVIAGFIVGRKATRAAESRPLLATTA